MQHYKSILAIALVAVVYFLSICFYKPYEGMYHQDGGDAFGYYVYLPSFFIYHDLADLRATTTAKYKYSHPGTTADTSFQNKYFMGVAVLQAPFFLGAHAAAGLFHQPRDGFSMVYMYAAVLSCAIYSLLGLFLLSLVLRRRFSDSVTGIVILALGLATNLYFLVVAQAPFAHAYLFFEYALLLYCTAKFYESENPRYILLIGMTCGLIILTRLNELYVLLIPALWGIRTRADISARLQMLRKFIGPVLAAGFVMILFLLPQLVYWKLCSGHFLYYSYGSESFDFLHPRIIDGLISGNNGWLMYCPIMILALVGIWPAARDRHPSFMPIVFFLPLHIYVIYSWWCWFYMGSYGSRPMTEAHALLSFPLAYSVEWLWASRWRKPILAVLLSFCIWLVMFQTYQCYIGIFSSEVSNWRFNLITLGKTRLTYEEAIVIDTREFQPAHPVFIKVLGENSFEDAGLLGSDSTFFTSGHRSVCIPKGHRCIGYLNTLAGAGVKPGQWIRASVNCLDRIHTADKWNLSALSVAFVRKGTYNKYRGVALQNKIDNPDHHIWFYTPEKWGRVYFYTQVPKMADTDSIKVYGEHINGPDIYIDDMKVELYEEK